MAKYYWAVRPVSTRETGANTRIERAATAREAYDLAFGRGNPFGQFEAKNLGSRVSVLHSNVQRIALLRSNDGWETVI